MSTEEIAESASVGSCSTLCQAQAAALQTVEQNLDEAKVGPPRRGVRCFLLQKEIKLLREELGTVRAHNEAMEDNNLDLRAQLAAKAQSEKVGKRFCTTFSRNFNNS